MSESVLILRDLAPVPRLRACLGELSMFDVDRPITLARAPGRLDVMGGIADYTGSLVCEMPLAVAAAAAVQRRDDGQIVCYSAQPGRTVKVSAEDVCGQSAQTVRQDLEGEDNWARYLVGCAWWLQRELDRMSQGDASTVRRGLSLALDSDVPLGGGVSSSAAIEVAVMSALCGALDVTLDPMRLAAGCQEVENHVVGAPCGVMDQVTATLGEADSMLSLLCQRGADGTPAQLQEVVRVPPGYAFVGVHSGVAHEVRDDPYSDTRTAAFMGLKVLQSLADGPAGDVALDYLAQVDPAHYRKDWQSLLPETMQGEAFRTEYGEIDDTATRVQPNKIYTVRDAVTHHVLEAERVQHFVRLIRQSENAERARQQQLVREAGELMIASHHSYGRYAKLGHAATDQLVSMASELGPDCGFYGSKITGGGCGGTVAMLIRDAPEVRHDLDDLRHRYTRETGRPTLLLEGTSPGAAAMGTMQWRVGEHP